jgi:hypothetical protein
LPVPVLNNLYINNLKSFIMSTSFDQLKELVAATEADATAFYAKGNKAAGTRLRKALQDIKNLAQAGRNEVTDLKNKESK